MCLFSKKTTSLPLIHQRVQSNTSYILYAHPYTAHITTIIILHLGWHAITFRSFDFRRTRENYENAVVVARRELYYQFPQITCNARMFKLVWRVNSSATLLFRFDCFIWCVFENHFGGWFCASTRCSLAISLSLSFLLFLSLSLPLSHLHLLFKFILRIFQANQFWIQMFCSLQKVQVQYWIPFHIFGRQRIQCYVVSLNSWNSSIIKTKKRANNRN